MATLETSASYTVLIIFDCQIVPFGISSILLTENVPKFVAQPYERFCFDVKIKHLTITLYHPGTNGYIGHYKKTLVVRLPYYISDGQTDCDYYGQQLIYAYSTLIKMSTKTISLRLVLSNQALSLSTLVPKKSETSEANVTLCAA